MKKQSGFTLIELMVVMAIIAILATAGLAAYSGYIKKARDTTRIADMNTLNTLVLSEQSSSGLVPKTAGALQVIATAANGSVMKDPATGKTSCLNTAAGTGLASCDYMYKVCDSGTGYALLVQFESSSNQTSLYSLNASGAIADSTSVYYDIGSCSAACTAALCATGYASDPGPAVII